LTVLDSTYNPLKMKAINKWVGEPLFNMKGSNPRQIHLDRGMLNGSRNKCDKEAKSPLVCWAWGT